MAEYNYNFDMFDEGTSAPKAVPQKKAKPAQRLHLVEETREVRRERAQILEKRNTISTYVIIAVALVLTAVVSSFIYLGASINAYDHKIASVQEELNIANSQNVTLNLKKDSMVSVDAVRAAAEKRGMIQRDRYQVTYFELAQEDYGVVK
ncbi:MAG: hypothetical protein IJ279_01895 [Clostridia bacterium]|nr:hypothetical protein [Clostridia bacterium]